MLKILNLLSGSMSGTIEKLCLGGFMFLAGKGVIPGDQAIPLSAAAYMLLSAGLTAAVQSETAKIQAINAGDNGVKVVPASAPAPAVNHPL